MMKKSIWTWSGAVLLGAALVSGLGRAEDAPVLGIAAGAQLWGQTCARCHNAPPPNAFRDEDWKIITHHMKIRANLTSEETQAILEFLQASN